MGRGTGLVLLLLGALLFYFGAPIGNVTTIPLGDYQVIGGGYNSHSFSTNWFIHAI